jgi:DNA helicase HerA-like ATPase
VNNDSQTSGGDKDRRDLLVPGNRFLGRVVACTGARATIAAIAAEGGTDLTELWSVGRLISITVSGNRVAALVYAMSTSSNTWGESADNHFRIEVELLGEVRVKPDGTEEFSTGISRYPYLGAIAHRIRSADLMRIYDSGANTKSCVIGKLTQDETIDAAIHIPSMLSRHFAVVGSTGVGKSTAVSLLLHKSIAADPKLRVLILDPHNEFSAAFPDHSVVVDTDTLDLPFWLMRLEEFAEVIFRGRPPVPDEVDILRDLIPEAKRAFRGGDAPILRRQNEKSSVTADTPVPYRMADLLAIIDERIGKLDGRNDKPHLRSLKVRITSAINDPRYRFMFSNSTINDTIMETVAQIFRIPGDDRPICTFQLSGIPSEVVNSVASVLCRMAFELALWSDGAIHMLVVCEEAHRYIPSDPNLGFFPTRQAIARIAKEGRKYGCSLGIITQRPGELDQTILSQCSTVFAMRLSNDRDQEIIRSAIPNSSISTISFISSIGNGEAIAFGEAVAVPMRMRFARVEQRLLPKAQAAERRVEATPGTADVRTIIARMRSVAAVDISAFQQNVVSNPGVMPMGEEVEPGEVRFGDAASSRPRDRQPVPQQVDAPSIEPYRPDMLPRSAAASPYGDAPSASAGGRFAEAANHGNRVHASPGDGSTVSPESRLGEPRHDRSRADTAPTSAATNSFEQELLRREQGPSLRGSILKKPLGSLFNKN